jgi:hypothetical protein
LSEEAKLKLSKYNSIQRNIQPVRKREHLPYRTPATLADIQIPDALSVTKTGDRFLFHDSGAEDPERFFIFATEANMQMLQDYHVSVFLFLVISIAMQYRIISCTRHAIIALDV